MATGPQDRIAKLIRDVEQAAKQLRTDIRKRAQAAPKELERLADRIRKSGVDIAKQVERYVHELRISLEGGKAPKRGGTARRTTTAKRKTTTRRRKTAS